MPFVAIFLLRFTFIGLAVIFGAVSISHLVLSHFNFRTTPLERKSGLDVTDEQLEEMRGQVDNIDWAFAAEKEKEFRHDVMGHIHAFGHVCPKVGDESVCDCDCYSLLPLPATATAVRAGPIAAAGTAAATTAPALLLLLLLLLVVVHLRYYSISATVDIRRYQRCVDCRSNTIAYCISEMLMLYAP